MYVRKDGTTLLFCTNKCYKNMVELKTGAQERHLDQGLRHQEGHNHGAPRRSPSAKVEAQKSEVKPGAKAEKKVRAQGEDRHQEEGQGRQEG
ncbi:MAG: hypothetical protein MZV70_44535 [Desulfobacterales bacterium]|nr:hypothetical protein [Desulfobacterales bacterium]